MVGLAKACLNKVCGSNIKQQLHCIVSATPYTTTVVIFTTLHTMTHTYTQDLHKMTATYSAGSITTFTPQQWGDLLAATLHKITVTYTTFTLNDSNVERHQHCNMYTTAVVMFPSSKITYNRHIHNI